MICVYYCILISSETNVSRHSSFRLRNLPHITHCMWVMLVFLHSVTTFQQVAYTDYAGSLHHTSSCKYRTKLYYNHFLHKCFYVVITVPKNNLSVFDHLNLMLHQGGRGKKLRVCCVKERDNIYPLPLHHYNTVTFMKDLL